jgi:hypothetical protein
MLRAPTGRCVFAIVFTSLALGGSACHHGASGVDGGAGDAGTRYQDAGEGCQQTGFETSPVRYGLPALPRHVPWVGGNDTCGVGQNQEWYTMDLVGDSLDDLVMFRTCADPTVGDTHWLAYPGTPTGFDPTPVAVSIPKAISYGALACNGLQTRWEYGDLNADGRADVALFTDCNDPAAGTAYWNVYLLTAAGYPSAPSRFALPSLPMTLTSWSGVDTSCAPAANRWTYMDVTGDGRGDLVLTERCDDPSVGVSHWDVYAASDSGFATQPIAFTLPPGAAPFRDGSGTACSPGQQWSVWDFTGDSIPDLVLTQSCTDPTVGASR